MLWGLHGDRDQPQQLAVVPGAAGAQGERGARRHRLQVQQPAVDRTVGLGGGDRTDRPGDRDVVQHAAVDHVGGPFRPGRLGHRLAEDAVHVPWEGFAAAGRLGVVVVGGGPDGGRLERSRVGGRRPAGVGQPAHRLPRVRPPAGPVPQGLEVAHRALLQVAEPEVGAAAGVPDGIPDRLVEGLRRRVQQGGGEDQVDTAPPQPLQPLPLRARLAGAPACRGAACAGCPSGPGRRHRRPAAGTAGRGRSRDGTGAGCRPPAATGHGCGRRRACRTAGRS